MASADELKTLGNNAMAAKNFDEAIDAFTKAIELAPTNHVLYSNRSAAYASKRDWANALKDAEKTTEIKPDWPRGWGRKGAALHGSGKLVEAHDAYEQGLKLDPNNAGLKSSLAAVDRAIEQEASGAGPGGFGGGDPSMGLANQLSDPAVLQKLMNNPKTRSFFDDPSFVAKLQSIQKNPRNLQELFSDPRMIQVLGVVMGVDMDVKMPDEFPAGGASGSREAEEDVDMPDRPPSGAKPTPAKAPEPEPEPELDEEALAKKKAKEEADKEKALGTENYKKRNFDQAIEHYSKAWDLYKDITYLNNLGAAYFEKGDYQLCIDTCTKAIEEGRLIYADFKMIAKSYARIGTAYEKLGNLPAAIENYQKSLTEHRTPDTVNKLRAAERKKIEGEKEAYIDPAKAEEARLEGEKYFKQKDFPGAVAAYSEMIKRAPEDARGYSNRAAAFIKLLEFPSALEDCNVAIKKDPKFVKPYIRKAQVYFGMRKYLECVDACEEATKVDKAHHNGAHAREIEQQLWHAYRAMFAPLENETPEQTRERLMNNPVIIRILQDPVMKSILKQAESDPAALREHMQNPAVKTNIEILLLAGFIRQG